MPDPTAAPDGDPIMVARFAVPDLPATFVRRARLARRVEEGVRRGPLVLVNGPAGAGKTLSVADWFSSEGGLGRAAWLTVEASDNAPGLFWAYLIEALRHHGVPLPPDVHAPADAEQVDPTLLGRLAAHLQSHDPPTVLVLDEFERIVTPGIAAALNELLRHASPGLRLVLVSRTEPLLPLHRYRAAGELAEVRAADLAFSSDEAVELFAAHGLDVAEQPVHALTERMDGWAAGLRLAALAAQQAPDAEKCLREFDAGQSTVADFLINEVFVAQPAETQDLLLRTCVLDRVHPDLADALTGRRDGARILADMQRANAFVTAVGHSWYRHHPLFAEILRVRLNASRPGLSRDLHADAARWLSARGHVVEALPHAATAGDWNLAATLLVRGLAIGRLFAGREAEQLARLFDAMPSETTGPAPELVRGALALTRYDPDRASAHLRAAEQELPDDDGIEATALRLTCACLRVSEARLHGCAERAEASAAEAAELWGLLPGKLIDEHPELSAQVMGDLGAALLWDGRFAEAGRALAEAAEAPEAPGTARQRHESLSRLGLIDVLDGHLARAEARARAAVAGAERSGLAPSAGTGAGEAVLAEVAIDRGELESADVKLRRADAAARRHPDPLVARELAVAHSRLLLARGDPKAALEALREVTEAAPEGESLSPWLADRVAATASAAHLADGCPELAIADLSGARPEAPESIVAAARARLALGEPEAALRMLDNLEPRGERGLAAAVQALLTRAQAADALGDPPAARQLVRRALIVADGERLRLPFRLESPWLRRALRADPSLGQAYPWLPADLCEPLVTSVPGDSELDAPRLIEPLSERERDVLERAAELMSTEEIAADLYLSVNTVKTHLKSINRKLAASRRGEAVRRARRLNLL